MMIMLLAKTTGRPTSRAASPTRRTMEMFSVSSRSSKSR